MSAVAVTDPTVPQEKDGDPCANNTLINTTIVQLVLNRLSQRDALRAAQVCKDWLATVQHHLLQATLRSPAALEHVTTRFASLERLALHNVKSNSIDFKHIARLKHLQSLTLSAEKGHQKMAGLEALASMQTLSHLTLRHMVLDPSSGLSHIVCKAATYQEPSVKNKGALLELTLHACRADTTLGELLLGEPYEAGWGYRYKTNLGAPASRNADTAIHHAGHPPNACQLQVLDLRSLSTDSPCPYKGLGKVTSFCTLVMRNVGKLGDNACTEIAKLTDLQSLDLAQHQSQYFGNKVSHRGIEALCSLPNLESLVLQGCAELTNTTATLLCNLHASLTHLDLDQPPQGRKEEAVVSRQQIKVEKYPGNLHAPPHSKQANAAAEQGIPEHVQPRSKSQQQQQEQLRQQRKVRQSVLEILQEQLQEMEELLEYHEYRGQERRQMVERRIQELLPLEEPDEDMPQDEEQWEEDYDSLMEEFEELLDWYLLHVDDIKEEVDDLLRKHEKALQGLLPKLNRRGRAWAQQQQQRLGEWAQEEQREQRERLGDGYPQCSDSALDLLHSRRWQWRRDQQQERERAMLISHYGEFTSTSVQRIAEGLPRLQSLVLSGDAVDRDACCAISHALPTLTALKLINCQALTDDALCMLEPLTMLRTLSVVECDGVTDMGMTHVLEACRLLQHVRLAYTPEVTSLSMRALHGLPLVSLDLSGNTALRDEVLNRLLATCPLLEKLVLDECIFITDIGVCAVATHALQLRHLSIQYCSNITVRGLRALTALPRLACVQHDLRGAQPAGG